MAILNFFPEFAPAFKKKLLSWSDDEEDEQVQAATDPSSGFFGDFYDYIEPAFEWAPLPEPEPMAYEDPAVYDDPWAYEQPAYEIPEDTSYQYSDSWDLSGFETEPDMGIGSAIGGAFDDIQWGPEPQDIGSAIGGAFDDYWFTDQMAPAVEPWGWANGATEDFWVDDREYQEPVQPLMDWSNLDAFSNLDMDFTDGFAGQLNASVAERGGDPWADVIDLRGMPDPSTLAAGFEAPEEFTGLETLNNEWQIPDFGSNFRDIASGFGDAFLSDEPQAPVMTGWGIPEMETDVDGFGDDVGGAISRVGSFVEDNVYPFSENPIPGFMESLGNIRAGFDMAPGWLPAGIDQAYWDSMSPDEKFFTLQQLGLGADDVPAEVLEELYPGDRMVLEMEGTGSRDLMADLGNIGGDFLHGSEVVSNQIGQLFSDATGMKVTDNPVLNPGQGILDAIRGDNAEYETPLNDTLGNVQESENVWDFMERQSQDYKDQNPWYVELAGQALNPGGGLIGSVDDVPRWLGAVDRFTDALQGGQVLGAIGDIPGVSAAGRNVLLPGAVGATGGGLTEAIFDPTFETINPLTGEPTEYDPGLLESIALGAGIGIGGNAIRGKDLKFWQGIENTGDEVVEEVAGFVLPKELAGAKPRTAFGSKQFTIAFQDDLDKALYIVAGDKPSKSDAKYMEVLREQFPGMSDEEIRAQGKVIRNAIKEEARATSIPAGEKVGSLEIRPIARSLVDEVEELDPALQPWQDTIDMLTAQRAAVDEVIPTTIAEPTPSAPKPAWEPILEDLADDSADLDMPPPPEVDSALRNLFEQVERQREWVNEDDGVRTMIWRDQQRVIRDKAYTEAIDRGASVPEANRIANAAVRGINKDNPLPALQASEEELGVLYERLADRVLAREMAPQVENEVTRVLKNWEAGKSPTKSELNNLYRIITGRTPAEAYISKVAKETIPGTRKTVRSVVDEVADTPLTPEEQATIGMSDGEFVEQLSMFPDEVPNERIPVESRSPAERVPTTEDDVIGETIYTGRGTADADKITRSSFNPSRSGIVDSLDPEQGAAEVPRVGVAEGDSIRLPARTVDTASTPRPTDLTLQSPPTQAGLGASDIPTVESVPSEIRPRVQEWQEEVLREAEALPQDKREDFLAQQQLAFTRELRGALSPASAVRQADNARARVDDALKKGLTRQADDVVQRWLENNVPAFNNIQMGERTHRMTERIVGGAVENRLANTMLQRGRELYEELASRGLSAEAAEDIVNTQYGKYLDARLVDELETNLPTAQRNALMEHALTALRMGGSSAQDPRGYAKVANSVGQASPLWVGAQKANSRMKNQMYGFADASVILGNLWPALQSGWMPLVTGYANRVANIVKTGVDVDDARQYATLAGLQGARAQDQTIPEEGTLLLSGTAGLLDAAMKGNAASRGLRAADRAAGKWNQNLTKAQFDFLLYRVFRQPIYEGNLVILKGLGQDINDPKVQRAAARMANSVTSAAPQATKLTRRTKEGAILNTAQFTRAQGDLLLGAAKLVNPKATKAERILAATTIATTAASIWGAQELLGNTLEIDPRDDDFGKLRLPDGRTVNIFNQQRQIAKAMIDTGDFLYNAAVKGEVNGDDLYQSYAQFLLGRAGPLLNAGAKVFDVGFDPNGETPGWNYPGIGPLAGKGDGWGNDSSLFEKALGILPAPTGAQQTIIPLLQGDLTPSSTALNMTGGNTIPETELDKALRSEGLEGVDDIREYYREKYPEQSESKIRQFFQKYPDARREDPELKEIREAKKEASENFERSGDNDTVGEWRKSINQLSDQTAGIFMTKEIGDGKRPQEDGAAQWIYDFNKTFRDAREDPDKPTSAINQAKLEKLQTEFWDDHKDPDVRKEIIRYQLANATTDAEEMYIEDIARLNGFSPKTGRRLTWGEDNKPMPNYFEMERYVSREMKNDETKEFMAGFKNWKQGLPKRKQDLDKGALIRAYIADDPGAATRPSGKPWTAAAIQDAINYDKPSKETPEFKAYREEMQAELMWFNDEQHWNHIRRAHED